MKPFKGLRFAPFISIRNRIVRWQVPPLIETGIQEKPMDRSYNMNYFSSVTKGASPSYISFSIRIRIFEANFLCPYEKNLVFTSAGILYSDK
jgi:hypothetical protein